MRHFISILTLVFSFNLCAQKVRLVSDMNTCIMHSNPTDMLEYNGRDHVFRKLSEVFAFNGFFGFI